MVSTTLSTTLSVAAVALLSASMSTTQVAAHGFLAKPKPYFKPGVDITSFTGTIMGDATYPGFAFNTAPSINMENFVKNFKNDTRHPNLKTLIEKNQKVTQVGADAQCGWTDPSKTSEPLVGNTITYGRNFEGTGEGYVHPGPCETWCDNEMVQQDMFCDETYNVANKAAIVPIDAAKCKGAKQLTHYWIAMHGNEWQVYLDCVGLSGATAGGASSSTPKPATGATTPKPATGNTAKTPTPTTATPVDNDADDEYPAETPAPATTKPVATKTPKPATGTTTPVVTPKPAAGTPAPTKKKCTRRMRQ